MLFQFGEMSLTTDAVALSVWPNWEYILLYFHFEIMFLYIILIGMNHLRQIPFAGDNIIIESLLIDVM